jgi:hypothetical protein
LIKKAVSNETFSQIEIKITNFINVIERFETEEKQLLKQEFDMFIKTCNEIIRNIEDALKRELMKPEDGNTNLILRYQKIMAEQKRKLKNLTSKRQEFIIEESKVGERKDSSEQEEQMGLLDNELETMEDFVKKREGDIINIHKHITMVNQISAEINIMIQKQSEDVEVVDKNMAKAGTNIKKANKELMKAADSKSLNKKKYMKLIACLLVFVLILMLMAYYR